MKTNTKRLKYTLKYNEKKRKASDTFEMITLDIIIKKPCDLQND